MRLTAWPRSIISITDIDGTMLNRITLKMRKINPVITQMIMELIIITKMEIQIKTIVLVIQIARVKELEGAKEK